MNTTIEQTELTKELILEVKEVLDNASWDWESSDWKANHDDCEKATDYLETQKFSVKIVREALEQQWDSIKPELDEKEEHEDVVQYCAEYVANQLAFDRIGKFTMGTWDRIGDNKKWYIESTVSFVIR